MRLNILFPIATLSVACPASAQTFPSQTQALPTLAQTLGVGTAASVPVDPQSFLSLNRVGHDSDGSPIILGAGALPLTAFAGAADVASLRTDVNAGLSQLNYKLGRGVALASAADIQGPAPGKNNRIGGTITTFSGQAAGAVSFSHRAGAVDVGGAFAFARGDHLAKAGAGFSF